MTNSHKKKETKNSNAGKAIAAGIAGAIAGGMAVAAAVVMSDKKKRKKVEEAFGDVKDKVTEFIDTVKSQPVVKNSTKKLAEIANVAKQKIVETVSKE